MGIREVRREKRNMDFKKRADYSRKEDSSFERF